MHTIFPVYFLLLFFFVSEIRIKEIVNLLMYPFKRCRMFIFLFFCFFFSFCSLVSSSDEWKTPSIDKIHYGIDAIREKPGRFYIKNWMLNLFHLIAAAVAVAAAASVAAAYFCLLLLPRTVVLFCMEFTWVSPLAVFFFSLNRICRQAHAHTLLFGNRLYAS